jgi:hypothetical protein
MFCAPGVRQPAQRIHYRDAGIGEFVEIVTPWTWVEVPTREVSARVFCSTYIDGTVEQIKAHECQDNGARYLTFVRYRIPFVTTVYAELVRRLDRYAVARVDETVSMQGP